VYYDLEFLNRKREDSVRNGSKNSSSLIPSNFVTKTILTYYCSSQILLHAGMNINRWSFEYSC